MPDTTITTGTDPVLRKIRGLLDKAEASTFEAETVRTASLKIGHHRTCQRSSSRFTEAHRIPLLR